MKRVRFTTLALVRHAGVAFHGGPVLGTTTLRPWYVSVGFWWWVLEIRVLR